MHHSGSCFPEEEILLQAYHNGRPRLFLCILFLFWISAPLFSQGEQQFRLTAQFVDQPLLVAISTLETQHGLRFSFRDQAVAGVRVNCTFDEAPWVEVADCLFLQHGLEAKLLESNYITLRAGAPRDWDLCLRTESVAGEVLPFVTLSNAKLGLSYATGDDGYLQVSLRLRDRDSLSLSYLGYASQRLAPAQLAANPGCPVIKLLPSSIDLASVTVREYLAEGISATADGRRVVLDPNQVLNTPGFADREVFRTLPLLPGISNLQETASNLSIRGGTPDQNLILWDNIPIYASGHYLGMVSSFSPSLINKIDVWRGRAEAEYGGHVSGVVRMTTDREISEAFSLGGNVSMLQLEAFAALPIVQDKSGIQLSWRGSLPGQLGLPTYGSYRTQALQGFRAGEVLEGGRDQISASETFGFGELNGRWQFNPAAGHEVTISGFWQHDDLNYVFDQTTQLGANTDDLESTNQGLSLRYAIAPSADHHTELWLTRTDFSNLGENEYTSAFLNTFVFRESGIQESSFKVLHTANTGRRRQSSEATAPTLAPGQLQGGIQLQQYNHSFGLSIDNRITGRLREVSVQEGVATVVAPFASYEWSFGEQMRTQFGLRLPWYGPTGRVYFEPRLNTSYQVTGNWLLKAGYGANHQFPLQIIDFNQTNVSRSATIWTLADGQVFPVQAGREFSLGISGQPRSWFFDLELYHKSVRGLSATSLSLETSGFATGDSRAMGMDLLVRKRWGNWRSWVVYSLSKTEWNFPEVSDDYFLADLDRRHQLRIVQTYKTGRWTFSGSWQLQSGAWYTPTTVGPTITEEGTLRAGLLSGAINSEALPVFHRADLSISYAWRPAGNADFFGALTVSLLNVYGRENAIERNYTIGNNQNPGPGNPRFFAQGIDRLGLGFTPNISASINWR